MNAVSHRLYRVAEAMQKQIDNKLNPASAQQNHTARRARIVAGMHADGLHLQRVQSILYAVADLQTGFGCPETLAWIKSKADVEGLLYDSYDRKDTKFLRYLDAGLVTEEHFLQARLDAMNLIDKGQEAKAKADQARRELLNKRKELIHQVPGFFPTPAAVVHKMIECLDMENVTEVFDPSCGAGDILDFVKAEYPQIKTFGVEVNWTLAEIAQANGHEVTCGDIFDTPVQQYKTILCNPPFEHRADGDHIIFYYETILAEGGTLVAICGNGIMTGSDRAAVAFQEFVEENGDYEDLPEDSFKESKTGVATCMVILHK